MLLVIIGPRGGQEGAGRLVDGCARAQSGGIAARLKRRGWRRAELAVADGALGFWQAIEEVWEDRGSAAGHKTNV